MKDLSKKLYEQLQKIEGGELGIEELEELTNDAQELYERLVILKYKAYEKYGNPEHLIDEVVEDEFEANSEETVVESAPAVEEKVQEVEEEVMEEEAEEVAIDFSAVPDEQPSFDFSASEEVGSSTPETEQEVVETESAPDSVEESEEEEEEVEEVPQEEEEQVEEEEDTQDIFKDSHVEKHEPEDANSLNQKLQEDDELSLRKKLQSTPVTDLKSEISIAKKFEYITFMFDGKNEIYEEAINALNSCSNGDEAREKLNAYSTQYNWDLENKSIIKFVELVERRYI